MIAMGEAIFGVEGRPARRWVEVVVDDHGRGVAAAAGFEAVVLLLVLLLRGWLIDIRA